ncbi:MAG: nicotinate (nicotinamide) nucleotide adenylyltransferase [bacterium]|nr:nicotinate (nicotinamide) nucleotide adenylyltransferase [bacterium]
MRVGVLGGTFDPVHYAHLALAEQARVQLNLDRVLFVPAWIAPHKPGNWGAAERAGHRLAMLRLAIADNPAFEVVTWELERGGTSYTVDTLRMLRAKHGTGVEFVLIIGADNWAIFSTWREPEEIKRLCEIAIYPRPGYAMPMAGPGVNVLEGPSFDLSGSWLRGRIGRGLSVRYLVPDAVCAYLAAHAVYSPMEEERRGTSTGS